MNGLSTIRALNEAAARRRQRRRTPAPERTLRPNMATWKRTDGRTPSPNPDACCLRNAFDEDAHSRSCDRAAASDGPWARGVNAEMAEIEAEASRPERTDLGSNEELRDGFRWMPPTRSVEEYKETMARRFAARPTPRSPLREGLANEAASKGRDFSRAVKESQAAWVGHGTHGPQPNHTDSGLPGDRIREAAIREGFRRAAVLVRRQALASAVRGRVPQSNIEAGTANMLENHDPLIDPDSMPEVRS